MIEDIYFLDDKQVRITAASIGVSKYRWSYVKEKEISTGKYKELMRKNRFDILPIVPNNEIVTEYFETSEPNDYNIIKRKTINHKDVIPLDTNIKQVIEDFTSKDRNFYFLSFHNCISGLITLGSLNSKYVQVYIFSLICELERELGIFLNNYFTNEQIESWVSNKVKNEDTTDKYYLMQMNFNKLKDCNLDNLFTEHFFMIDFFNIILYKKLYTKLSFSKIEWKKLSSINELRNQIAHPTRSLLDKENNINKLGKRLNNIEDLTFRLIALRKAECTI